jgi:transcriptional regulator with XRE-family HTH domain
MELRIEDLGPMIRNERNPRGVRAAAEEIGISPATLSRIENGQIPDLQTFAKICRWLNVDPARFLGMKPSGSEEGSLPVAHFRKHKVISRETAHSLGELILSAQRAMQERKRLSRR